MHFANNKRRIVLCIIVCVCFCNNLFSGQSEKFLYRALVDSFYHLTNKAPFWISSPASYAGTRRDFLSILDSAMSNGLDKYKYHYATIANDTMINTQSELMRSDSLLTDAVIAFSKDIYEGADISRWIMNDEISGKYSSKDNNFLLSKLSKINSVSKLNQLFTDLLPKDAAYTALQQGLKKPLSDKNTGMAEQLISSLNLYRWIHHFHFEKVIVVNIPSASLRCYMRDSVLLQMKVVVGKPSTRTPRFSTYCNEAILYPYWNVPRSIAVKELLPKFKKSLAAIDAMNMQVITKDGKIIDPYTLNWKNYNKYNFPYNFRQCTGCDNSLGVIKFDLTDPFSVYLHDTNFKKAFESRSRYISHGCIRVQNPTGLYDYLLPGKLDTAFINACIKNEKPITQKLNASVPVFVVYMTAEPDSTNNVILYKDIYHLFK